jgi:HlyD family secretion protein
MSKDHVVVGLVALAMVGVLTGCGGSAAAATTEATQIPVVASDAGSKVVAEAVIEPGRSEVLSFEMGGDVVEVLVQEGDAVKTGDPVARLETVDLERTLAQAELSMRQAQVSQDQAQLRLAQLQEPADEVDVRQAERAVEQASAALQAAQLDLTAVLNSTLVNEALEDAQRLYDDKLHVYQTRLAWYESGQEPEYWFVEHAKEELDDAKLALDRIKQRADAQLQGVRSAVLQAQHAYTGAQDALEQLLEGADPLDVQAVQKEIEAAQLGVEAAVLALDEAQGTLKDATLTVPFEGIVAQLDVDVGDAVTPGQPVLVLATLDRLQAKTKDLTELDVVKVQEGQIAVVTVDALPDRAFTGVVREIALQPGDYRGDVVYTVTIDLTDTDGSPLRWGMTALVEIEVE